MDEIEELKNTIASLQKDVATMKVERHQEAVRAELIKQMPEAPKELQNIATYTVSAKGELAGNVSSFLAEMNQKPGQAEEKAEKPSTFAAMLADIKNGTATLKF